MAKYRVEMMDKGSYDAYMMCRNDYTVQHFEIEAETAEEALAIAKNNNPELIANEGYVRTVEELENARKEREAKWEAFCKAEEERKARAKARKEEREKANAEAMGLTVKQYRAKKRLESEIRKAKAEMERIAKELAEAERKLENLTEIY